MHALGSNTLQNPVRWGHRDLSARKREGYIAALRRYFERGSLNNWNHFRHSDLVERNELALTFKKRHLPLSDGKDHPEFGGLFKVAKEWVKKPSPEKPPKNKRKAATAMAQKASKKAKVKTEKPDPPEADPDEDDVKLVMDPKTGKVVELVTLV